VTNSQICIQSLYHGLLGLSMRRYARGHESFCLLHGTIVEIDLEATMGLGVVTKYCH
jgi:hypothetical protein